ncbi:MAG: DUF1349 domain-containing protein [Planctomycetia bacterium]|nr:DUF1349 domain-containing protein [Planctomycetia bacterium]
MLRITTLFALLVPATLLSAPIPPLSEKQKIERFWGKIHAPTDKHEFKLDGRHLTIRTDGEPTDKPSVCNHTMHPRVARTVTGDFEATVRVVAAAIPDVKAKYPNNWAASRAGMFVSGGDAYAELELFQYFVVNNGVPKDTPNQVVWVNTSSKRGGFHGRHITKIDPTKPLYLRITRKDKIVTGYYSSDGKEWTPTNWGRGIELPDEVTVGIYFAHTTHQHADATFSDFTIEKLTKK